MRFSVFNGFYTYSLKETVPFFTTLAVAIIIAALIYDYLRRRIAHRIITALNDVGAHAPSSAMSASRLYEILGSAAHFGRYMLRRDGALRRYVRAAKTDAGAAYYIPQTDGAHAVGADAAEEGVHLPASLRGGGEHSVRSLIFSIVLLIVAAELFIRFFPTLYEYIIGNSRNLFS